MPGPLSRSGFGAGGRVAHDFRPKRGLGAAKLLDSRVRHKPRSQRDAPVGSESGNLRARHTSLWCACRQGQCASHVAAKFSSRARLALTRRFRSPARSETRQLDVRAETSGHGTLRSGAPADRDGAPPLWRQNSQPARLALTRRFRSRTVFWRAQRAIPASPDSSSRVRIARARRFRSGFVF